MYAVKTPILLIGFKRKDCLKQVLNSIKLVKPSRLYIALDGPRIGNCDDEKKCIQVRKLCDSVDWCNDVRKKYREINVGCKKNVEEAISWAFESEEQLIILEDDIVPRISFYKFCDELLDLYNTNKKVWRISGFNACETEGDESYYFSKASGISGWATWKDRWHKYDGNMQSLEDKSTKKKVISAFEKPYLGRYQYNCYISNYKKILKGTSTSWAYPWSLTILYNEGISICPTKSLVTNVGFGDDSLNKGRVGSPFSIIIAKDIDFPLKHPKKVEVNMINDSLEMDMRFRNGYPFWYAYLGQFYRKIFPSGDLKVFGSIKKTINYFFINN